MRMKKAYASLCLSERLSQDLLVEPGEVYPIAIGKRKKQVVIGEDENDWPGNSILVGSPLARELRLPGPVRLNVIKGKDILRIGPLVGIMATQYKGENHTFGAQDRFFRSLIGSMKSMNGLAFVFTPSDIDFGRKMINGYYLNGDSNTAWQRHWFPFPDVCYNRYVKAPNMARSRDTMLLFSRYGVASFNTAVGNKWTVYKHLDKIPGIACNLPETRILSSPEVLADLLWKYKGVYVKPINGSKGRDISRITRSRGGFLIKNNGYGRGKLVGSLKEAYNKVRSGNWGERLIAQQAIIVLPGHNHFDIRVMVQKGRKNNWVVSGLAARVGGNGQVTTNLHTGGHAEKPEKVLAGRGLGEMQIEEIIREIKQLALNIAQVLDIHSRALGDLGMDFIIDDRGKVWFLEVNPKPGRRSFAIIDNDIRKSVVSKPMEYACYLAGF